MLCSSCSVMKYCTLHSCHIEDVERGAELSFSGRDPLRGHMVREADPPLHHRQILFSTNQIFHQTFLVSDRTDGRTDGRTDAISMFWSAIVWPDFASKVRLGRQGRPAEASGLRPSALASRPPALVLGLPCFLKN